MYLRHAKSFGKYFSTRLRVHILYIKLQIEWLLIPRKIHMVYYYCQFEKGQAYVERSLLDMFNYEEFSLLFIVVMDV